ncbi:MAG: toll/interleukin-1 receptor domain-containing protein [Armatimonadota bacterium]|jgi:hypothetical protein|nr:toll/interleukin-1 receptor domain-containing protein [Armatimonadota bacterium]
MAVFISHRTADDKAARLIYDMLTARGIKCYIDDLDSALKTTDDVTRIILERLDQCSHLLAVVSVQTAGSWWVPFEIGVGTVTDRRIASYNIGYTQLPHYLLKWPVLKSSSDLEQFARFYKDDKSVLLQEGYPSSARTASVQKADDFHRLLKNAIGQR